MSSFASPFRRRLMLSYKTPLPNYLKLTALEDTTFTLTIAAGMTTTNLAYLRYSVDGMTWNTLENVNSTEVSITTPTIEAGESIYLKGKGNQLGTSGTVYSHVSSTGKYDVSGNIASLLYEDTFETFYSAPRYYFIFGNFFRGSKVVHAGRLVLPVRQQHYSYNLYTNLFLGCTELIECAPVTFAGADSTWAGAYKGCTSLEVPPVFPEGLTLAAGCFSEMFSGCTSLTTPPALPATTVAAQCYKGMFYGCSSLTSAPDLPATTAANSCYREMFAGCTNITTLPNIAITTLANYCFCYMFSGSGITSIPSNYLPVTTLADNCYCAMFYNCKQLTSIPENLLPATTLAYGCYRYMFEYCAFESVPENLLPATTLAEYCYDTMFGDNGNLLSGPKLPVETLVKNCYYSMFFRSPKVQYLKMYATDISASNCLYGWMGGVKSAGLMVKHIDATWTTTGQSGVPTNWSVIYYDPTDDKYYTDQTKTTECDDHGNPIV